VNILLNNENGCDSLVITTTTLLQSDTTYLTATSCLPIEVGVVNVLLNNTNGCDSLVVTTTTLLESDTTYLTEVSCNSSDTGVVSQVLINTNGCDSLIITATTLLQSDTTYLNSTSCTANQIGVTSLLYQNIHGCDSLVIETTILLDADTIYLNLETCDSSQAGVFINAYQNQSGCDSLVITTIDALPIDTIYNEATSCNPADTGMVTTILQNVYGCDSIIFTKVTYALADTVYRDEVSCNPALVGSNILNYTNQYGCDSLIFVETTLVNSDTTYLNYTSCNPADTGLITTILLNENGCDSIIYINTTYVNEEMLDASDTYICVGESAQLIVQGGSGLTWSPSTGLSCTSCSDPLASPGQTTTYTVTAEGCDGFITSQEITVFVAEAPQITIQVESDFLRFGDSTTIDVTSNQLFANYTIATDMGLVLCTDCSELVVQPENSTIYVVTAINDNGCESEDRVTIDVSDVCVDAEVEIPNLFSPNGDGANDLFEIRYQGLQNTYSLNIYNRWGQLVYTTNDLSQKWDGTFRGENVMPGVYVYYFRAICPNGKSVLYKGNVTLVR
jgi:gliding motility-associated-like protein